MLRCLLLSFALWLVGAAPVAAEPVLMIFGDSLSAGHGIDERDSWVHLLRVRLEARGYSYRVVNASIGGDTTASGRARLPQALREHEPDVVVVELGGNDGLRGLSLPAMRDNLRAIVQRIREANARVLLVGMRLPPNYGPRYTQQFHDIYRELSETMGIAWVPFLLEGIATRADFMQADGIHPAARAQPHILDNLWPRLVPLLSDRAEGAQP